MNWALVSFRRQGKTRGATGGCCNHHRTFWCGACSISGVSSSQGGMGVLLGTKDASRARNENVRACWCRLDPKNRTSATRHTKKSCGDYSSHQGPLGSFLGVESSPAPISIKTRRPKCNLRKAGWALCLCVNPVYLVLPFVL